MYNTQEARTRETFLALMWALSHPGRAHTLPQDAPLHAIAETLLDLETSYYTPDADLSAALARTGARELEPDRAAYHFYPALTDDLLEIVRQASVGTMLYPDQAATLVIGCRFGSGRDLTLSGPGIPAGETVSIQVGHLPDGLWMLRDEKIHYPLGWDVFLIDGDQVVGLPRTTQVVV